MTGSICDRIQTLLSCHPEGWEWWGVIRARRETEDSYSEGVKGVFVMLVCQILALWFV